MKVDLTCLFWKTLEFFTDFILTIFYAYNFFEGAKNCFQPPTNLVKKIKLKTDFFFSFFTLSWLNLRKDQFNSIQKHRNLIRHFPIFQIKLKSADKRCKKRQQTSVRIPGILPNSPICPPAGVLQPGLLSSAEEDHHTVPGGHGVRRHPEPL